MLGLSDTIAARATPPGRSALAVVRVSGADVERVWNACARTSSEGTRTPPLPEHRLAVHAWWHSPGATFDPIDEVIVLFHRGPLSPTGENLLEIIGHGSESLAETTLAACLAAGARLAHPGEFTRRAFEHGKITAAQARGVAELIAADTRAAQRQAVLRLQGGVDIRLRQIEESLTAAAAWIEARIDVPADEAGDVSDDRSRAWVADAHTKLSDLVASHRRARAMLSGVRVALLGAPNAGKSSLFNAMLGRHRALVSPTPGTTRDTIEARIDLDGLPVTLIDTAGLRAESDDPIERAGMSLTREAAATADALLWLHDATTPWEGGEAWDEIRSLADCDKKPLLFVMTKADMVRRMQAAGAMVSDRVPEMLSEFLATLREALVGNDRDAGDVSCADSALAASLTEARDASAAAMQELSEGLPGELVVVSIREALGAIAEWTGSDPSEAMLDRLFRDFCLGK